MRHLPPLFREQGMQSHRGFEALADQVRAGDTREEALRALARITNTCVACHAIYRLEEAR